MVYRVVYDVDITKSLLEYRSRTTKEPYYTDDEYKLETLRSITTLLSREVEILQIDATEHNPAFLIPEHCEKIVRHSIERIQKLNLNNLFVLSSSPLSLCLKKDNEIVIDRMLFCRSWTLTAKELEGRREEIELTIKYEFSDYYAEPAIDYRGELSRLRVELIYSGSVNIYKSPLKMDITQNTLRVQSGMLPLVRVSGKFQITIPGIDYYREINEKLLDYHSFLILPDRSVLMEVESLADYNKIVKLLES